MKDDTIYYKSWKTMMEISEDRGYDTKGMVNYSVEEFHSLEKESTDDFEMVFSFEKKDGKLSIFWLNDKKFNAKNILAVKDYTIEYDTTESIVITEGGTTPACAKTIKDIKNEIRIDVYTMKESQINIMKHYLVPIQTKCSPSVKKAVKKAYAKIPKMSQTDAVARHLGLSPGDIVEVKRIIGEYDPPMYSISYRQVV